MFPSLVGFFRAVDKGIGPLLRGARLDVGIGNDLRGSLAGQQAGGVLILCDNTTERVALLGGQQCDNTPEKAALSCNMLWSQRPYEVVMSFTRSKPGPRPVSKIVRNLSGTTHPTLTPIGGRPSYSRPKRNCSDLE